MTRSDRVAILDEAKAQFPETPGKRGEDGRARLTFLPPHALKLAFQFNAFSAEINDLAVCLIALCLEGIAFRFRRKEGCWELVKLPALNSLSFRDCLITLPDCLITLTDCLITLALGGNQGAVMGEPEPRECFLDLGPAQHENTSLPR
jgi:hypothetical protein